MKKLKHREGKKFGQGHPILLGVGEGNPLQYSCPENPMDRGAWQAIVHGVPKSQRRMSDFTFTFRPLPNIIHKNKLKKMKNQKL